jgi:hypothetical protein
VAYPAEYRSSGVMTFVIGLDGVVYQKDLGKKTDLHAKDMKDPIPVGKRLKSNSRRLLARRRRSKFKCRRPSTLVEKTVDRMPIWQLSATDSSTSHRSTGGR